MKKSILYKLLAIVIVAATLNACQEDQEVDPVQSTENYPTASYATTADMDNLKKGDVIVYSITMDRMSDVNLSFGIDMLEGSEATAGDFLVEGGSMPAFSLSTTLTITVLQDYLPEPAKQLEMEVGVFALSQRYILNPKTVNPVISTMLGNGNDPDALTINVEWDNHDDDWDVMIVDQGGNDEWSGWAGATGANPEIAFLLNTEPDDTYFVEMDPWSVDTDIVKFRVSLGKPDQTSETFNLTWDVANEATYPFNWGYQLVKIEKAGSSYTLTMMPGYEEE